MQVTAELHPLSLSLSLCTVQKVKLCITVLHWPGAAIVALDFRLAMNGMLPVWDFSVPELEQLQAEQAELIWNPLPDVTDADIHATIGLSSLPSPLALPMPDGGGVSTTRSSGQREDDSWEPSSSAQQAKVTNRRQASLNAARQDSFPTPSPSDNYVQDDMEEPSQRQRTGSSDNSERSKAVNRESQRRFRLRQKVARMCCFVTVLKPVCCPVHCSICQQICLVMLVLVQARSQAVEAQLASTTAELRELKSRQHQLEVRNMLLEKVSQLNKSTDPQSSSEVSRCLPHVLLSFCLPHLNALEFCVAGSGIS